MVKVELTALALMVLVISFLGFVLENIWLAFTKGYMDNRNMSMPFLLGYGILVIGMYLIIGTPENVKLIGYGYVRENGKLIYFLLSMVVVSIGEIILGTLVEHFMGFVYWNYEWIPLHITKYTSVPTSIGFASIICLFMEHVFPMIMEFAYSVYSEQMAVMCGVLMVLCTIDMISSYKKMYHNGGKNQLWRYDVHERSLELSLVK